MSDNRRIRDELGEPVSPVTTAAMTRLSGTTAFVPLEAYGDTSLGAVTGGNRYFALSPVRVRELGIPQRDLLRISPPGSSHLRGLSLTRGAMTRLAQEEQPVWLLYPSAKPAAATVRYIEEGHRTGADQAYKCRVRKPWWRVPVLKAPDLFLTYMNANTARLPTNTVGARHLNSVHGVYLTDDHRELARDVLPIASLNSMTLLSADSIAPMGVEVSTSPPPRLSTRRPPRPDEVTLLVETAQGLQPAP